MRPAPREIDALYLLLLSFLSYHLSYAVTYALGLRFAYGLNRLFVFNSHRGARSIVLLPMIYLIQYLIGAAAMHLWIELLGQSEATGPLVAVAITLPVTYMLSKFAFVPRPS